ncbi:hypothetical protein NFI96_009214 [Prochilodus magdalenae]|nr:hypothetical protein NFI96_009214 [Prochilodus magdalenae]
MSTLLSLSRAEVFSVSVPSSVSAALGSSVILHCELSPSYDAKTLEVRWYRNENYDNPILLYQNLKVQKNNRVSLIGELEKGNVSLKVENLTLADRGEYVCFVKSAEWYDKASVNLNITDSEGLVSVSSWVIFSPSESEWISCSVGLSDQEMKEGRVLAPKPAYKPDSVNDPDSTLEPGLSSGWKAFTILLVICLLVLTVMGMLPKIRGRILPKDPKPVSTVSEKKDKETNTEKEITGNSKATLDWFLQKEHFQAGYANCKFSRSWNKEDKSNLYIRRPG